MAEMRKGYELWMLLTIVISGIWWIYDYQYEVMPDALSVEDAGETGFSEVAALKHVKALSQLGPHPLGSTALDSALQYVLHAAETIKKEACGNVNVEVELFHANSGVNDVAGGKYNGKTLVYSDLNHVLIRISSKSSKGLRAEDDNAILASAHVDTVFSAEGAGDDSSNVAVMLELARGISQQTTNFKNSMIFLFNTGDEDGMDGSHSFITQHPWSKSVRLAVDLESLGLGGKSGVFQVGPDQWAIENFAKVAKYPTGQIITQELFSSGIIQSSTDFQVYQEIGGLSGLEFGFTDSTSVYHTKNDKYGLLKSGSLQHLGENLLPFLLVAGTSTELSQGKATLSKGKSEEGTVVYFDILGKYMVVYSRNFASMLHYAVILLSVLIWISSLLMGGYSAFVSLAFSFLSILLMWICSIGLTVFAVVALLQKSPTPVPFIVSPWLAVGVFAAPALLGAFVGQHVVYLILQKFLSSETKGTLPFSIGDAVAKLCPERWMLLQQFLSSETKGTLPFSAKDDLAEIYAERWMFKAGLLQWLVVLAVGTFYNIGSSYLALVWLVSPAIAYGLIEARAQSTKPLNPLTLLIGLFVPFVISAGVFLKLVNTLLGSLVRFESNPGEHPEWMAPAIVALLIAALVCLTMVYLLPFIHNSGAKYQFVVGTCLLFGMSIGMLSQNMVPAFVDDAARAINLVEVMDVSGNSTVSHVSLFSSTPGGLFVEAEKLGEEFVCGTDKSFDFVTFKVKYSCWTEPTAAKLGSDRSHVPALRARSDVKGNSRATVIHISTANSTRWSLGINADEIKDFKLQDSSSQVLISRGEKNSVDGCYVVQFAGGRKAATNFDLTLYWQKKKSYKTIMEGSDGETVLLKLRADMNTKTPQVTKFLNNLPCWCTQFGTSTFPFNLAYFYTLLSSDVSLASE